MDKDEVEFSNALTKINHTNYVRNSRAVMVLWGLFHIVFVVLNMVVFAQPQWIGDDDKSPVSGFFGLYRHCVEVETGNDIECYGDFLSMNSLLNDYFKACAIMTALSCLFGVFAVTCFVLFFLLNSATVLKICGWLQVLSGILLLLTCIIYPAGWDHKEVRSVCGIDAEAYDLGVCNMRWGYFLGIVLIFDAFILAILAFVLASKQANLLPSVYKEDKQPITD